MLCNICLVSSRMVAFLVIPRMNYFQVYSYVVVVESTRSKNSYAVSANVRDPLWVDWETRSLDGMRKVYFGTFFQDVLISVFHGDSRKLFTLSDV